MRASIKPAYDPAGMFAVYKPFTFQGRDLRPGDPFVAPAGSDPRRIQQLLDARMIQPTVVAVMAEKGGK